MRLLTFIVSLVILGAIAGIAWQRLQRPVIEKTVAIRAPDLPENALPVYAQFTVTQTFALPELARVTKLVVPVYVSQTKPLLTVDLRQAEKLIARWRLPRAGESRELPATIQADLPLTPPELLEGTFALHFSAPDFSHDQRELAPRLFIEPADANYPDGSYRIAENQKEGDVAVQVFTEHKTSEKLQQLWRLKPFTVISRATLLLLLAILAASLPGAIASFFPPRTA